MFLCWSCGVTHLKECEGQSLVDSQVVLADLGLVVAPVRPALQRAAPPSLEVPPDLDGRLDRRLDVLGLDRLDDPRKVRLQEPAHGLASVAAVSQFAPTLVLLIARIHRTPAIPISDVVVIAGAAVAMPCARGAARVPGPSGPDFP